MAKPLIVKRNVKGSALTFTELDANFQNLDDATFTLKAGSGGTDVVSDLNGTITLVATDGIAITGNNTAKTVSIDASVVQDTSPQLGGDLDVNGFKIISSATNGNIVFDANGNGKVNIVSNNINGGTGNGALNIINVAGTQFIEVSAADQVITFTDSTVFGSIGTTGSAMAMYGAAGSISIANTSTGDITIAPGLTGNVNLDADTVRVGDSGAAATITSNGAGNLVINTNAGTNAGSITLAQGTNGNITVAPNGTGLLLVTGLHIGVITPASGSSPITGRHQATSSPTQGHYSFNAQKNRTDILLASMSAEAAVIAFSVRDSSSTNRIFARLNATYQGTGTLPYFQLQTSVDDFTTTNQTAVFGAGVATWGVANSGYVLTTNGTGNLTLHTNSGTNSGSIVITQGTNANLTLTPNGTGQTVITNLNYNEVVYTAGTTTGTITPDTANGTIQSITLTGSITFNAFTSPVSGETLTLIITQPASGGPYTLTSTMKFAGSSKTLSTAANSVDILTVSYIGTTYYANLAKAFA